jgi:hypothetical protein
MRRVFGGLVLAIGIVRPALGDCINFDNQGDKAVTLKVNSGGMMSTKKVKKTSSMTCVCGDDECTVKVKGGGSITVHGGGGRIVYKDGKLSKE